MRTLLMTLALVALVCVGCGDKEDDAASTVDKMKDAGSKTVDSVEFACAKEGCTKTKTAAAGATAPS